MQTHKISYCCSVMQGYVDSGFVTVNNIAGTAHMKMIYTPTPENGNDQNPSLFMMEIKYCPNCGDKVTVYSEDVPIPTYTRATLTGASCNDQACRFIDRSTLTCKFQFRNDAGCYSTDDAAKQAYADLRDKVQLGFEDMSQADGV